MVELGTHVNLHLLVQVVLHYQAMREPDPMRLHGMASDIGVVSNVGIVEVGDLLGRRAIEGNRPKLGHVCFAGHCCDKRTRRRC